MQDVPILTKHYLSLINEAIHVICESQASGYVYIHGHNCGNK